MINHKLLHKITNDLWAIIPEYLQTLCISVMDPREMRGSNDPGKKYIMRGSVAVVPIHGALGKNLDAIDKEWFGMTDYDDIEDSLMGAADDPNVSHILMHVDSPGGTVVGLPELASKIRGIEKPVTAYTEGMAASAAYWLAAQADNVILSESASVGSIGVYVALLDQSKWLENLGLKVNAISAGKHKLDYAGFKPLSDDARDRMQASVDKWHARFKSEATTNRPIPKENMEGQTFEGVEAVEAGLANGVVNSLSELLTLLT